MNEATSRATMEALDTASRHWREEYDRMTINMIANRRRENAISAVQEAISRSAADATLSSRDIATLIVDNSELALKGFDALNTTQVGSRWRQIYKLVVPCGSL